MRAGLLEYAGGSTAFNLARIEGAPAGFGAGQVVRLNNISLDFDFTALAFQPQTQADARERIRLYDAVLSQALPSVCDLAPDPAAGPKVKARFAAWAQGRPDAELAEIFISPPRAGQSSGLAGYFSPGDHPWRGDARPPCEAACGAIDYTCKRTRRRGPARGPASSHGPGASAT